MSSRLTPVRVHRVVSSLLAHLGTPAKAPKPCGVGRLAGPKAASLAEPNATRRSKRLPECLKRANARGLAMDIMLIAEPLAFDLFTFSGSRFDRRVAFRPARETAFWPPR